MMLAWYLSARPIVEISGQMRSGGEAGSRQGFECHHDQCVASQNRQWRSKHGMYRRFATAQFASSKQGRSS
ncbi:MAG: hypothetical protein R3D34_09190 [Nitratireductor sp.]